MAPPRRLAWLWAIILLGGAVPLALLVAAGVSLYNQAINEADLRVERSARIGEEQALKVFQTNIALLHRVLDALGDDADEPLLAREAQLHQQLRRMSADLMQLQGIFVIGASGRMLVTDRVLPAPHGIDFSDRPFFVHHRQGGAQPFISQVLTSRTTGEPFFDMSVRRSTRTAGFAGTVSTSMAPGYFAAFYREISDHATGLSVQLHRADGILLAGWPQGPSVADAPPAARALAPVQPALRVAAGATQTPATTATTATAPTTATTATRQVGSYPVFVTARIERSAVLAPWYRQMGLMLALTLPAASGLVFVGWLAMKRTRHALQVADSLRLETQNRQKAEASLRQSQKMEAIGQLTGGVAHDFNNLLQVISANLHLIGKDVAGQAKVEQRLAHATEAVKRGAKLASQLLAFGRRQPLAPKVVNVGKLVLGLEDMVRRSIGDAIEVEAIVSGGLWTTAVDPAQIENAILNLAINARDAMQGAGKLTIEVLNASLDDAYARQHGDVSPGQYVLLAVSDTGSGMTPEVAAQAFEPFFTTKPTGAGTGLGLSMVYGFVKQSGGHAKIYSELGHGTTVRLYLPRSADAEDALTPPAAGPLSGGAETILVVEDDAAVRAATIAMLAALGYRLLEAPDADRAALIIDSGRPIDLLFTDVVMPGALRSPELARRARARWPGIAVLYTSGYTQNAIVHGGRLDAGVELLPKPYTAFALASRVRAVLNKRPAHPPSNDPEETMIDPVAAPGKAKRPTVLLVEDDDLIRTSTAEMVRDLGYPVVDARSAEEAIELIGKTEVGVLMADIGLPGMSGDVFAAQALIGRRMAIVFATGSEHVRGDPTDDTGPVLLRKPYDTAAIDAALQKALKRA